MARLISFCGSTGKNTGGIDCDIRLGNPRMLFVGGAKFTPEQYATEAALKTAIINAIRLENGNSGKLYPFPIVNQATDNREAPSEETLGDGTKRQNREGKFSYLLESAFVGLNQEAALLEFNNAVLPAFIIDDTGKFIGKFDLENNLVGSKVQLNTTGAGLGIFTAGTTTKTSVSWLDPRALSSNARLFDSNFDLDDFEGLLDATLKTIGAAVGNAHKVGVFIDNKSIGKNKNLYDQYADALAVIGAWRGYTAAGALVAATTAVKDAVLRGWTVTFGSPVTLIDLARPQDLDAIDVAGIEGVPLAL